MNRLRMPVLLVNMFRSKKHQRSSHAHPAKESFQIAIFEPDAAVRDAFPN